MTTEYTIYLINNSTTRQTFWCFLDRPQELADDSGVYANSSAYLTVEPNDSGDNTFTIPVQYTVGAGASNQAVGSRVKIKSSITKKTNLQQSWFVEYATMPLKEGPKISTNPADPGKNGIGLITNDFNQPVNDASEWYSHMSFGIETSDGFIGMTWSPEPQKHRIITPKLKFYVAIGEYGDNTLARWDEISINSQEILVPDDFLDGCTTVTYDKTGTGGWSIKPGKPKNSENQSDAQYIDHIALLVRSHLSLSNAHGDLVALVRLMANNNISEKKETVVSVTWDSDLESNLSGKPILSGTITVKVALAAAFTYFTISALSGSTFQITSISISDKTIVKFTYDGPAGADKVKQLLVAGATVLFGTK